MYSREALDKMEKLFSETQYPDIHQRERLSTDIGVPEARIQVLFHICMTRTRLLLQYATICVARGIDPELLSHERQMIYAVVGAEGAVQIWGHCWKWACAFGCACTCAYAFSCAFVRVIKIITLSF